MMAQPIKVSVSERGGRGGKEAKPPAPPTKRARRAREGACFARVIVRDYVVVPNCAGAQAILRIMCLGAPLTLYWGQFWARNRPFAPILGQIWPMGPLRVAI